MRAVIAIGAIVIASGLAYTMWPTDDHSVQATTETGSSGSAALAQVQVPDVLSQNAQIGERAYVSHPGR